MNGLSVDLRMRSTFLTTVPGGPPGGTTASEGMVMERRLDVRHLEPPEPMELILDALDELPAGDWLRVRHRREPYPLYNVLRSMDFSWRSKWEGGELDLLIWHKDQPQPL